MSATQLDASLDRFVWIAKWRWSPVEALVSGLGMARGLVVEQDQADLLTQPLLVPTRGALKHRIARSPYWPRPRPTSHSRGTH